MILYITLWIVHLLFVIKKKDNKTICVITYLILGILFVSNAGLSGDAAIYKNHFKEQAFSGDSFEMGYTFLEMLLYICGIQTYTGLLSVIFVLGTVFLWIGLKKYNVSYHCLLAIVMPFIFPTYAVAIRFFLASTIMVAAIRFLNEKKYWLFTILVICAGSFHVVALFYIVFILCGTKRMSLISTNRKFVLWFIVILSMLNFVLSVMLKKNPLILAIVKVVAVVFNIDEIKIAYATTHTNLGGLIFLFTYLWGVVTAISIRRTVFGERRETDRSSDHTIDVIRAYSTVNYNINLILSAILPFVAMNLLFYRLLTIGHISNAITIGMYWKHNPSKRGRGVFQINSVNIFFILSALSWFIPEIIGINDITIKGIFKASMLFGR